MLEIFGKNYFIDVDEIIQRCRPEGKPKRKKKVNSTGIDIDDEFVLELNVFKFEILKACLERLLNEIEPEDNNLGPFTQNINASISFKIAFNTLLKNKILIEDDNE